VRNRLRALSAIVTAGIAVAMPAHRVRRFHGRTNGGSSGASTSKLAEGTLPAYKYAVKNRADILDADVRWTKDGPRP
jgi:glycerophosphoryl diester phosphodiesterase